MAHKVSQTGFLAVWCVSHGLDMYGYSGLGDQECVSSEFTVRGSPVGSIGTATSVICRQKPLQNRCLLVPNCPVPVPNPESGLAIAPKIFDSWQISKCKASESQPNQKTKPKNLTQK